MKRFIIILYAVIFIPIISLATDYTYLSFGNEWWGGTNAADWDASGKPGVNGLNTHTLTITNGTLRTSSTLLNWTDITINSNGTLYTSGDISNSTVTVENTGTLELADGATIDANTTITVKSGGTLKIGEVTVNGTIILEEGASIEFTGSYPGSTVTVNGTIIINVSADENFDWKPNSGFTIASGGVVTFVSSSPGTYDINQFGNNLIVEAGGTLNFEGVNYNITGGGDKTIDGTINVSDADFTTSQNVTISSTGAINISNGNITHNNSNVTIDDGGSLTIEDGDYTINSGSLNINGTFKIEDGNVNSKSGGSFTVGTTGEAYLYDTDDSGDDGRFYLNNGGNSIINYGILFTEAITAVGSGSNNVANYDVLFVKVFTTDGLSNSITNTDDTTIDSDFGEVLDSTGTPYDGSYLFYCSSEGSLSNIINAGTVFYHSDVLYEDFNTTGDGEGVNDYYSDEDACIADFYGLLSSILPIELAEIEAEQNGNAIEISWITASEENNDYFTIYESCNGSDFDILTEVAGAGTSSTVSYYSTTDNNPETGINYYKLSQTDYDGKTVSFSMISALYVQSNFSVLSTDGELQLFFPDDEKNTVEIYSISGLLLYSKTYNETKEATVEDTFAQDILIVKNTTMGQVQSVIINVNK